MCTNLNLTLHSALSWAAWFLCKTVKICHMYEGTRNLPNANSSYKPFLFIIAFKLFDCTYVWGVFWIMPH